MASALAPALSPRRGGIVRRSFENLCDWIGRTLIRKTRNKRKLFPLPSAFAFGFGAIASKRSEDGGKRIKGEAGINTHSTGNVEEAKNTTLTLNRISA
jgi:hypothetical protein